MKLRPPLSLILPLAVSACVTLPEIGMDHPAHPDASQARAMPLSNTLTRHEPATMSHDHGVDEDGHAMPESENKVTLYTCPMDPEVVQDKPGSCPICGMRLKPKPAEADHEGGGHDHDR